MFESIKNFFSKDLEAAGSLTPTALPKAKAKGGAALPSFFTSAKMAANPLPKNDRGIANVDLLSYRSNTTNEMIRTFSRVSPELSSAVHTALRLGIPDKYVAVAYDLDGVFNPDATATLQQLLTRFDVIGNADDGFSGTSSIKALSESLGREMLLFGSMAGEVVLDKARQPARIAPVSVTQIEFIPDNKGVRPIQKIGSATVDLDTPAFIYISSDQDLLSPYSASPLESSLKAVILMESFQADLQRIISRAIHPRLKAVINEEAVRRYLSPEAQMDPEKANAELNAIVATIEQKLNLLQPQEALVFLDSLDIQVENTASSGLAAEWDSLKEIANSRLSSGSKTLPSVLGLATGDSSSNIASTQAATYLKCVDGLVRQNLNSFFSRALTISLRLMGMDVYCKFEFEELSLRTPLESEAFMQTRQMRHLELLDLGLISDEEASLRLTGKLPPAGFKPLSGTRFKTGQQTPNTGPAATDTVGAPSNDGSTLNQKSNPQTPTTGRGQNKKV